METNGESAPRKKYKHGQYCSVPGCNSRSGRETELSFNRVMRANKELTNRWVKAINRTNHDGQSWYPSKNSMICGRHFVTGTRSLIHDHVDYVPSINLPLGEEEYKAQQEVLVQQYVNVKSEPIVQIHDGYRSDNQQLYVSYIVF